MDASPRIVVRLFQAGSPCNLGPKSRSTEFELTDTLFKTGIEKWAKVVKDAGITASE
jgi:hypothetical protein